MPKSSNLDWGYTVKNKRNFTDPVMGNWDKKSTGNREFTGKCPYILYIKWPIYGSFADFP